MEPVQTESSPRSDSAVLGILAGLMVGIGIAVGSFYLIFVSTYDRALPRFYSGLLVAIPNLLPLSVVIYCGIAVRRSGQPRFSAGFFIAAALLVIFEASCAVYL